MKRKSLTEGKKRDRGSYDIAPPPKPVINKLKQGINWAKYSADLVETRETKKKERDNIYKLNINHEWC